MDMQRFRQMQRAAMGGAAASPSWLQAKFLAEQSGTDISSTFDATTTAGSYCAIIFALYGYNGTLSSVVGNISGGGTEAFSQVSTTQSMFYPNGGQDVYIFSRANCSALTGITVTTSAGFGHPPTLIMEMADVTAFDALTDADDTTSGAGQHTYSVTTTGTDSLIVLYGGTLGTVSSFSAGSTQIGAQAAGIFGARNTTATGAAGSKSIGVTHTGSTSSSGLLVAFKA